MAYPAIEELKTALASRFPILAGTYLEFNGSTQSRLQSAPGDHSKNPNYCKSCDPHVAGLALDIILFARNPKRATEQALAEDLVDLFVYYKAQMRWSAVIYNGATTDDFGGPKPYTGSNNHQTHIHIEWPLSRATTTGYTAAMAGDLDDLADDWSKGKVQ